MLATVPAVIAIEPLIVTLPVEAVNVTVPAETVKSKQTTLAEPQLTV
jgi:hypothetical protein